MFSLVVNTVSILDLVALCNGPGASCNPVLAGSRKDDFATYVNFLRYSRGTDVEEIRSMGRTIDLVSWPTVPDEKPIVLLGLLRFRFVDFFVTVS